LGWLFFGAFFGRAKGAVLWILQRAACCFLPSAFCTRARGKRQCAAAGRAKNVTQKNNGRDGGGRMVTHRYKPGNQL